MDKRRLFQIVSLLLIPYLDEQVMRFETDPIANIRHSFYCLSHRQNESMHRQRKLHKDYERAERSLDAYLRSREDLGIRSIDDFRMLIDHCFPEREIVNLFNQDDKNGDAPVEIIDWFYYNQLFNISKSLLTFRDGRIAIKTWFTDNDDMDQLKYPSVFDKVEIWNLMSRMITTDTLIAAYYICCGRTDVYNLHQQQAAIFLADKTLESIYRKGMAETHLHLNAGIEFQDLWHGETDLRNWKPGDRLSVPLEVIIYRFIWASYVEYKLETGANINLEEFIEHNYIGKAEIIKEIINCLYYSHRYSEQESFAAVISSILLTVPDLDVKDLFMGHIYRKYAWLGTNSEMVLLFRSFHYFERYKAKQEPCVRKELHLFLQYIRHRNQNYRKVVQSNQVQGLTNFRFFYGELSNRNSRYYPKCSYRNELVFRNILNNRYLEKLEVRIVPETIKHDAQNQKPNAIAVTELKKRILLQISHVLDAYKEVLKESLGVANRSNLDDDFWEKCDSEFSENKLCAPSIGIIFHFLKRNDVDNRIADTCWLSLLDKKSVGENHILELREIMIQSACAIEDLRGEIPLLSEYVVGLDVASEEIKTEPWVFAEVYHRARNRLITKPVHKDGNSVNRINNMGFTFHVGEEFRHILTGLRHIDEVLTYFHYKTGDRIGHATALGVPVDYWMRSNEAIVMPISEYMEDLIWLWGNMVDKKWGLQINVEALEGKILSLAKKIYGNLDGINVYMLYQAYKMKFDEDYVSVFSKVKELYQLDAKSEVSMDGHLEHFCRHYKGCNILGNIWTVEKVFCTYFCPVYTQLRSEPIIVPVEQIEKSLFESVQEKIREEVEKQGIFVETNPTSNLAIGEQKEIFTHHILSLNSRGLIDKPDVSQVLVSVNTDNPIIFCTSIENELAYIYHSLIHLGFGRESVIEWIDKVRQMGMDSSFIKSVKKPSQQYRELEELHSSIESYLKST